MQWLGMAVDCSLKVGGKATVESGGGLVLPGHMQ